jgi:uncharacterized membrane protein (Fun14 family)
MSESLEPLVAESLKSITPILYSVGVGAIGGFFVGYIVKKILNLAIILGVLTLGILYLGQINVIKLDFEEIIALISEFENFIQAVVPLAASVPFTGSFFLGFLGGLR